MGGNVQLGVALINPRSQELNKSVLDLCDNLVLMRQRGNAAIDAVQKWMDKVSPDIADKITTSLPNMSGGQCWVWAENSDTPVETRTSTIHSFHPDRTKGTVRIKSTRQVDTTAFVSQLLAELPKVVEEQKANDPAELKKQLAIAKREHVQMMKEIEGLRRKRTIEPSKATQRVEVPVLKDSQIARIDKQIDRYEKITHDFAGELATIRLAVGMAKSTAKMTKSSLLTPVDAQPPKQLSPKPETGFYRQRPVAATNGDLEITGTQQRVLDALAWYESNGVTNPSPIQVGVVALIDGSGGHFSNTVGPLSTGGLVVRENGTLSLTDQGRAIAKVPASVGSLADYHEMLCNRVRRTRSAGGKTVEILRAIINRGGADITVTEIGQEVHMDASGGHFSNMIGPLGTLGLIERNRGIVHPTEVLFPPSLS
jgi:hypothetical protein